MKKRFIALFVAMVMILGMFAACSNGMSSQKPQKAQMNSEPDGNYHMFYTRDSQGYLNFLEAFDETEYEIVDISHGHPYWYVTYKDVEE